MIEETQGRLNRLEVQLQAQLAESIRQASEIDMLVQLYEESVRLFAIFVSLNFPS